MSLSSKWTLLSISSRHLADLGEPGQAAVVLGADLDRRQLRRLADLVARALAVHHAAVAARHGGPGHRALFGQEGVDLGRGTAGRSACALERLRIEGGSLIGVQLGEVGVGQAVERRLGVVARRGGRRGQHDLALQLAAPGGEVARRAQRGDDHRRGDRPVGRRRPGDRDGAQLDRARRDHAHAGSSRSTSRGRTRTAAGGHSSGPRPCIGPGSRPRPCAWPASWSSARRSGRTGTPGSRRPRRG